MKIKFTQIMKVLYVNMIVFVIFLLICELALGIIYPDLKAIKPGDSKGVSAGMKTWAKVDPDLGWVFSGRNTEYFANKKYRDIKYDYQANRQGFRDFRDFVFINQNTDKIRVMLLGDSFVFGIYLNESRTLSSVMQRKLKEKYEVYNLGMPGWGIDQMYLAYKKYSGLIKPQIVVLIYIDDDIKRNLQAYRFRASLIKPRFHIQQNYLMLKHEGAGGLNLFEKLAKKSMVIGLFYVFYRHIASMRLTRAIFTELIKDTRRKNEKLIIVRYPMKDQIMKGRKPVYYNLEDYFDRNKVMYLDPYNAIRKMPKEVSEKFYLQDDCHPSGYGNEYIADYIIKNQMSNDIEHIY